MSENMTLLQLDLVMEHSKVLLGFKVSETGDNDRGCVSSQSYMAQCFFLTFVQVENVGNDGYE